MRFFTVACGCGQPLINFNETEEMIRVFRTREAAELELSSIKLDDDSKHAGHKGIKVQEVACEPISHEQS